MAGPLFLERRGYRMRRMMDAVRFLPLLGVCLWMVPLLWPVGSEAEPTEQISMSSALWYIFAVWIAMIVACYALWRRTQTPEPPDRPD